MLKGVGSHMQICPKCQAQNKEDAIFCEKCGEVLPAVVKVTKSDTKILTDELQDPVIPKKRWGTARFDEETVIMLHIRGHQEPVRVPLSEEEVVLGRRHGDSDPDIDFSPYDALAAGVSRRHASLRKQNETVVVIDLESANNTYLNGQRIIPNEPRILRDGDELRLGNLIMRASFEGMH